MPLITFIIVIAVIGFLVWAVVTYIPMPQGFKTFILVVAAICVIYFVLQALGLIGTVSEIKVPHI